MAIQLRYNPSLINASENPSPELQKLHGKETDPSRTELVYSKRRKKREDALLEELPIVFQTTSDDEFIYNKFCKMVNNCYDTDMLLIICNTFQAQLESGQKQRYAEYLFAKLAAWATADPRLAAHLDNLGNLEISSNFAGKQAAIVDLKQEQIKKAKTCGRDVLIGVLKKLGKNDFFKTLNEELNPQELFSSFQNDRAVSHFLSSLHRPKLKKIIKRKISAAESPTNRSNVSNDDAWLAQQKSLLDTQDKIESALNGIDMFSWNKQNREEKFIAKIINALNQKGDTLSIGVGAYIYNRKTITFNRQELLVLIRSDRLLCAEFKRALGKRQLTNEKEKDLFANKGDTDFVPVAKGMVTSLNYNAPSTSIALSATVPANHDEEGIEMTSFVTREHEEATESEDVSICMSTVLASNDQESICVSTVLASNDQESICVSTVLASNDQESICMSAVLANDDEEATESEEGSICMSTVLSIINFFSATSTIKRYTKTLDLTESNLKEHNRQNENSRHRPIFR